MSDIRVTILFSDGIASMPMNDYIAWLEQQRDKIEAGGGPELCACGRPMGTCGSHKAPTSTAAPAAHSATAGAGDAGGGGAGAGAGAGAGDAGGGGAGAGAGAGGGDAGGAGDA